MKKVFILLLALIVIISSIFVACAKNEPEETTDELNSDTEFGFETQEVTDDKGKAVTDKDGNVVTTEVPVIYKKDKKGRTYAQLIDSNGDPIEGSTIKVTERDDDTKNNSGSYGGKDPSKNTTTKPNNKTTRYEKTFCNLCCDWHDNLRRQPGFGTGISQQAQKRS